MAEVAKDFLDILVTLLLQLSKRESAHRSHGYNSRVLWQFPVDETNAMLSYLIPTSIQEMRIESQEYFRSDFWYSEPLLIEPAACSQRFTEFTIKWFWQHSHWLDLWVWLWGFSKMLVKLVIKNLKRCFETYRQSKRFETFWHIWHSWHFDVLTFWHFSFLTLYILTFWHFPFLTFWNFMWQHLTHYWNTLKLQESSSSQW